MFRLGLAVVALSLLIAPLVWSQGAAGEPNPPKVNTKKGLLLPFGESQDVSDLSEDAIQQLLEQAWQREEARRRVLKLRQAPASKICLAQDRRRVAPLLGPESGDADEVDLCDVGRQLSRTAPCGSPRDCQALLMWEEHVGTPAPWQARPAQVRPVGARPAEERPVGARSAEERPGAEER